MELARWQTDALRALAPDHDLVICNCLNGHGSPRRAKHALYYLLNLWAIRNLQTRRVAFPSDLRPIAQFDFEPTVSGQWQGLPPQLLERLHGEKPLAIVKFGMGLLSVPTGLNMPILSYHHGDPRHFRGRPAGFYELHNGAERLGQVVQILTNDLDAGAVVAFAETKIHPHSYRATLVEAYRASPLLLRSAIATALAGDSTIFPKGSLYRLPSNGTVLSFALARLWQAAKRLGYGAFVEKRWQIAEADAPSGTWPEQLREFPPANRWEVYPTPKGFRFIADPFFDPEGGILAEGLDAGSGRGAILRLNDGVATRLMSSADHFSYPAAITVEGNHYLIPEIAESDRVRLFKLGPDGTQEVSEFSVDGSPRLVDPTLFEHGGAFYLFANRLEEGNGILRLWVGKRLVGPFREHPQSPVRISPAGSRMAGAVIADGTALFRVGQDFSRRYGDGLLLFEIKSLSPNDYSEMERSSLKFDEVRGPHTVNVRDGKLLFDFYRESLSLFAGWHRFRVLLATRWRRDA